MKHVVDKPMNNKKSNATNRREKKQENQTDADHREHWYNTCQNIFFNFGVN